MVVDTLVVDLLVLVFSHRTRRQICGVQVEQRVRSLRGLGTDQTRIPTLAANWYSGAGEPCRLGRSTSV